MDPLRLCLENFMGHKYSEIDCSQFRSVLIVGVDKNNPDESNGVGKTTIFHAIVYALYNEYPTKTIDKIIKIGTDRCRVTFEFNMLNVGTFKVVRSRSRKSGKGDLRLYKLDGNIWSDYTQKTATEIENELKNIIKIPYNAFRNSVFYAQNDLNGLDGLASKEKTGRRQILKDALDLAIYSKLEKTSKEKITSLNKEVAALTALVQSLGDPSSDIQVIENELSKIKNELLIKNKEKDQVQLDLNQNRFILNDLQKLISTTEINGSADKLAEIRDNKKQIQNSINSSKKIIAEKEIQLQRYTSDLNSNIINLNQLTDEYEVLKLKPIKTIDEIKKDLSNVLTNESNGRVLISTLENECNRLRKPIPDGDVCPHCRQVLTVEHRKECLKQINIELQNLEKEVSKNKKIIEVVTQKKNSLEFELKETVKYNNNLVDLASKISNKKIEINHNQNYIKQISELTEHTKNELNLYLKKIEELTKREEMIKESIKKSNHDSLNKNIEELKSKIDFYEKKLHHLLEDISADNTKIGIFSEKINQRTKDLNNLEKLKDKLNIANKNVKLQQMVTQGFGAHGIPSMIINTILDDLQIECNKLLGDLLPGLELNFSIIKNKSNGESEDTLDISYRLNGHEMDYEMLSGGQKMIISLSLKLGLSLVIQHLLGTDIRFIQLDEVDQPLDKARVRTLAEVVKKLQDKFKIFVITHNDTLKNKFSHAILVEKGEDGSSAKVVTSW